MGGSAKRSAELLEAHRRYRSAADKVKVVKGALRIAQKEARKLLHVYKKLARKERRKR